MKEDYHQQDQDSPPFMEKEYYRVVEDTPSKGFTVEECYKVVGDTPINGFTAEEFYKITNGPEAADSFEDLDKAPEGEETLKVKEDEVVRAVYDYFSETKFDHQNLSPVCKASFPVGPVKNCEADIVLRGSESQPFVAIAECKGSDGANYGRRQLLGYLCANNTRFGLFANSLNPDNWIFYENLRHFRFRLITRSQFENEVISGNHDIKIAPSIAESFTEDSNLGTLDRKQLSEDKEESEVKAYFWEVIPEVWEYSLVPNHKIQIGSEKEPRTADFVLRGRDGSFIAIADTKYRESKSGKGTILNTLLSATDTKFGIIAHSVDRDKWKFVKKSGVSFNNLERAVFAASVVEQAIETACPVFKGDKIPKEDWDEYSKTWKTLKSEKVWRVAETYHPKCSLKVDEYISDDDYKRAQESYPGCSVKKDDILTKAKLDEQHKTWSKLTTEKVWRVTEVFHPRCSLRVGQYISHTEYEQARVDYLGCSVKKGDILTKAELTEHRKAWKNLKAEKVWCVTETDYQQLQKRIQDDRNESQSIIKLWQSIWGVTALECKQVQDEYDRSQSKIKLWQFITAGVGLFFVCFGGLFLMQRNATEDAVHQNAVFINQLTHKESEIGQKDRKIQSLTTLVQTLEGENETLNQKVGELENSERNRTFPTDTTSVDVVSLRRQLSERKNENQKLQNQLVKRDAEIRQLRNDKAVALNENRKLQSQLVANRQGSTNQSGTVRQLQSENQELKNRNRDITRQNQKLQKKNKVLQNQLDNEKQSDSNQVEKFPSRQDEGQQRTVPLQAENLVAEPPEKIQDYSKVIARAGSHNNQGCLDFEANNYGEAVKQFEQAIKADSKFAVAHYNLGCVYLEMKEYSSAVDAFDKAIALNQKFKEAYCNRSLTYFRTGRFQEAKRDATKVLDIDPNYQLAQGLLTTIENAQR